MNYRYNVLPCVLMEKKVTLLHYRENFFVCVGAPSFILFYRNL